MTAAPTAMITVLVPAHNEATSLPATLASLAAQTRRPDRVLVVSDNSTDATVAVAAAAGVDVMETSGNTARKAGALNQALAVVPRDGFVLVMDADTVLVPGWIEAALAVLAAEPDVGGVGAVFEAAPPTSYLELCQRLEWVRYAEETGRTGRTFVMSGTAALIRWAALADVEARFGRIYDEATITEDSRLSIDLKLCGWVLRSPLACRTITETMPTWRMLWLQRRRWYLGALQNVTDTGWSKVTAPYWRQQVMLALAVLLMGAYLSLTAVAVALHGFLVPTPFWLAVGAVFALERVATVWDEPIRRRVFAALVLPELLYALVLQSAYAGAVLQKITRSAGVWAHVTTTEGSPNHVRL